MSAPPEKNKQPKSQDKEEIHRCKICGICFPSGPSLGGHMRKHFKGKILRKPKWDRLPRNTDLDKAPSKWEKGETSSKPPHYKGGQKKHKTEPLSQNFDLIKLRSEGKELETSSKLQHYKGDPKEHGKEPLDCQSSNVPEKVEPLSLDGQSSTNVQNREPLPLDGQSLSNVQNVEPLPRNFDLNELPPEYWEEVETSSKAEVMEEKQEEEETEEKKEEKTSISDNFNCKKPRLC